MLKEFVITGDGSQTLYIPELDEHYHSTHGAINESNHVYINNGFYQIGKPEISILEIGFGTGLNALLTYEHAKKCNIKVDYYCLEKYPLSEFEFNKLEYWKSCSNNNPEIFRNIHISKWGTKSQISDSFTLIKSKSDLLPHDFKDDTFDLIYYDAFGPSKQAEMWTEEILRKVAKTLNFDGIFVTYCAKGSVRRALSAAGISMERIPGPVGKKEILRGKRLR